MQKLEIITSSQNNRIKELKKLSLKKYRLESGSFLVENYTIIKDALESAFDCQALFVTQDFIDRYSDKFAHLLANSQADYYIIDEKVNRHYSSLDNPSGITAVYNIKKNELILHGPVVYLDNISDPGNLGTIMRSALAFGFKNLVLGANSVDAYNSKTIAAAKDAIFKLNILEDETGNWLENNERPLYTTSSHGGINLHEFKAESNFCLVLGSESHGVDNSITEKATQKIKIEMSTDIESLNVAVAASIIMYKLRQ